MKNRRRSGEALPLLDSIAQYPIGVPLPSSRTSRYALTAFRLSFVAKNFSAEIEDPVCPGSAQWLVYVGSANTEPG